MTHWRRGVSSWRLPLSRWKNERRQTNCVDRAVVGWRGSQADFTAKKNSGEERRQFPACRMDGSLSPLPHHQRREEQGEDVARRSRCLLRVLGVRPLLWRWRDLRLDHARQALQRGIALWVGGQRAPVASGDFLMDGSCCRSSGLYGGSSQLQNIFEENCLLEKRKLTREKR